jgi:hypothetical protein
MRIRRILDHSILQLKVSVPKAPMKRATAVRAHVLGLSFVSIFHPYACDGVGREDEYRAEGEGYSPGEAIANAQTKMYSRDVLSTGQKIRAHQP